MQDGEAASGGRLDEAPAKYSNLQGVGRAMAVLEELAERPMRAKELTDVLGIKWTTAYRTIAYLHDNGFLERDEATGRYYIAARLYYIGSSYVNHLPILQSTDPFLGSAAQETGATVQVVQRYRRRSIVLAVAEPTSGAHIPKTTIGWHFPLHCGAKGQILLAYSLPAFIDDYLADDLQALTPHTITEPDELRRHLEQIRRTGFAISKRDVQLSTGAVASPITDASGQVVASLTLIVHHSELRRREARLVEAAAQTAQSISINLGWRPDAGVKAAEDGDEAAGRVSPGGPAGRSARTRQ